MKIPETSANVGAYYGNEENGQWQPNGVIIDSGVGGGVVGSGDAGVQRPLYPVHMPREHIPGYVMAGAYYPPAYPAPVPTDDFADYMWMENEEEFDKQVMQQLEEEALMEQCIEAMLEDEQRERHRPNGHHPQQYPTSSSNGASSLSLEETVSRSRLNPLAAEFVPTNTTTTTTTTVPHTEEKPSAPEVSPAEPTTTHKEEEAPTEHTHTDTHTDPTPPPSDPPEVSAADIQTDDKRRDKHKKTETKKPVVKEVKAKVKPAPAKSESKVAKKEDGKKKESKEVRVAKSEDVVDDSAQETKPQPPPVEEPTGPKPINYAAAAKANKPRAKPTTPPTPPAADKASPPPATTAPPALPKSDKKKVDKPAVKTEKPVQRKNSAK